MAPEQLKGETVDVRADVYSLAVVTYEMLTGRLPFGSGSFYEIGVNQASAGARIELADVPAAIAETLGRGLALNRNERPATVLAFADALRVSFSSRPAP